MITRVYLKCKVCGSATLVRFQVGWLDFMPFAFGCPKCKVVIKGRLIQDQENVKLGLESDNSEQLQTEPVSIIQEIECSGELPVKRYTGEDAGKIGKISPYIHMSARMGFELMEAFKRSILSYLQFKKDHWPQFMASFDLFTARNYQDLASLLSSQFRKVDQPEKVTNVITGFYDLVSWVTVLLLPPKYFENNTEAVFKLFGQSTKAKRQAAVDFLDFLFNDFNLEQQESDGIKLLVRFFNSFEYFLPVISLSYCSGKGIAPPYGGDYRITTTDFNTIKQLYADSFEWIGRNSTILIGSQNIINRSNFSSMPMIAEDKKRQVKTITDYVDADNGMKIRYLKNYTDINRFYSYILDNEIRNAINHYKTTVNPISQIIQYYPYKGTKASISKTISLIDLTDRAYRQFAALHDLLYLIGGLHFIANK